MRRESMKSTAATSRRRGLGSAATGLVMAGIASLGVGGTERVQIVDAAGGSDVRSGIGALLRLSERITIPPPNGVRADSAADLAFGNCARIICASLGVHPRSWVQLESNSARIPSKTVIQEKRRAKEKQRDSTS
jgi:hypothetical protein